MCENKKLFDLNVVAIHLLQQKKKVHGKCMC